MNVKLILHAEGTTINLNQGTIRAKTIVENHDGKPVSIHPGQINVRLSDHEDRELPVELQGRETYEPLTVDAGSRREFAMTLHAPDIKISEAFNLKAWWQDVGSNTTSFHFRQTDPT